MRRAFGTGAWMLIAFAGMAVGNLARGEVSPPAGRGVPLPHRDILNPDGATPGTAEMVSAGPLPESQQEIRRPAEPGQPTAGARNPPGEPSGGDGQRVVKRQGSSGGFGRLGDFVPLIAVLGLILAAAWMVKRFMPARRLITGAGVMEILARLPLSGKQSLVLLKLGQRLILVGVSPERVNTVCIVDDPEQVALLIGRIANQARGSMQGVFDSSLNQEAEAFGGEADEQPPSGAGGPIRGLLDKVKKLSNREVA